MVHFPEALEIKPIYPEAHNGLRVALARQGRRTEAIVHFKTNLDLATELVGKNTKK